MATTTIPLQAETSGRPTTLPPRQAALMSSTRVEQKGNIVVKWLTSTDHKTIGYMYLIASVLFFLLGGVMALIIRAELFEPGMQIVPTKEQYNQLFTMHGTIMLLMFATPLFAGFANVLLPLQIGAPDVAFPRLNMFAYWLYLFGGIIASAGFLTGLGTAGISLGIVLTLLAGGLVAAPISAWLVSRLPGAVLGTAVGVLPGIGPALTVALLLPVTYQLDPAGSLIMFAGIYYGGMYGGSTTSILLNTPTPA